MRKRTRQPQTDGCKIHPACIPGKKAQYAALLKPTALPALLTIFSMKTGNHQD